MSIDDDNTIEVTFDIKGTLRGLLDVAKVGLGDDMPEPPEAEMLLLLRVLLATVERSMPADLQAHDVRLQQARALLHICEITG